MHFLRAWLDKIATCRQSKLHAYLNKGHTSKESDELYATHTTTITIES